MDILFFTHTRLGDAVLSTGVIRHFTDAYPAARITVVCSPLTAGIFSGIPQVKRVIAVRKQKWSRHWLEVWRQTRGRKWDIIVDLRNSLVSRVLRARQRYIWRPQPDHLHKVEQIGRIINVAPAPSPKLWFDQVTLNKADEFLSQIPRPRIAVAPVANWIGKTWPSENFAGLIERLDNAVDPPLPGASYVIMAGPGEEAGAKMVLAACPPGRGFDAIARFSPIEAAAVIAGCDAFIGNDSGLMHCAAAAGVPTLGLFGPSKREVYRPWGANAHMVATPESFAELQAGPGYSPSMKTTLMKSLSVDAVYSAFKNMMQ
jgi:ADP-heptose:LPS heptosyltransferase